MTDAAKYSDQFVDWLVEEGYTHCFFVAGGNIMHLLDSVRTRMECVPFVNEIGAAIAAEYFTASSGSKNKKAFVLVTAGPGLTNTVTAIASAWVESRELLIVGGQVKSSDLSRGLVRQRGIQEIDGVNLVDSICKATLQIDKPVPKEQIISLIRLGSSPRKGPVFLELCLDAQAAAPFETETTQLNETVLPLVTDQELDRVLELLSQSQRPAFLLGGGVSREDLRSLDSKLQELGIPILLTWNGADLLPANNPLYAGRPNTWGQRSANIIQQQADLLIAIGTRLGIQQTGFAWEQFLPVGKLIHVDIDDSELTKGHPESELAIQADANHFLTALTQKAVSQPEWEVWNDFIDVVRERLPLNDPQNVTGNEYVKPFEMLMELSNILSEDDVFVPSSSGSAFTVAMQSLQLHGNQKIVTNKGMASMGYGLSGAIGASLANRDSKTILIEGDGSFAQNLQELGTVASQNLNVKILLFANDGYASIRMTQRNYFNGAWIGCDSSTGLGLPDWNELANSFGIPYLKMNPNETFSAEIKKALNSEGPSFIEVPIDPEQTFFPKIMSSVQPDGSMSSNPLHLMHPPLSEIDTKSLLKFIEIN